MAVTFKPTTKIINNISQILYKFIWTNYPTKRLSNNLPIAEIEKEGVKMIDI